MRARVCVVTELVDAEGYEAKVRQVQIGKMAALLSDDSELV